MAPSRSRIAVVAAGILTASLATAGATVARSPAPASALAEPATVVDTHVVRVDRRAAVAASAPDQVVVGQKIVVRGVAKVRNGDRARGRPVEVAERSGGSWVRLAGKRTRRNGAFRFALIADAPTTLALRVKVRRFDGLPGGRARLTVRVVAAPQPEPEPQPPAPAPPPPPPPPAGPAPLGSANDWSYVFAGGSRWDPCQPIGWGHDPTGGYAGSLADVDRAFDRIAERTGLPFVYEGSTGSDVNIDWSNAAADPDLAGDTVGIARTKATQVNAPDVKFEVVEADITFDSAAGLRAGHFTSGSPSWGQVMVHEILHGLGLGHASGDEQIMAPFVSSLNHLFGAGDLTGMTQVGGGKPCL